jgi:hypothetical protein
MNIKRVIKDKIEKKINNSNKVIVIYGARQVGKTTLVKEILGDLKIKHFSVNADQEKYIDVLSSRDLNKMKLLISGYDLLFIDEAQRIPDVGLNLKILTDEMPELKIIATGSSSFDLANKISEPLTGRTWSFTLYPLSILELKNKYNNFEINERLDDFLVYGLYPEVFTVKSLSEKEELLKEIGRSYLYKDVLDLLTLKQARKIKDLLKLLAFQIGSEVSILELATSLSLSRETVEKYIELLEKSFVLFRLSGLSRNLRKEVTKMDKIYFYDLGIRNMVIDNFKSLPNRNDAGQLWENFLIVERMKAVSYLNISTSIYFWRTHTGAELDYIEDRGGELFGYEFKFGKARSKIPKTWEETYNGKYLLVNRDNWIDFLINQ